MSFQFKLRFDRSQIGYWAARYKYKDDRALEMAIGPRVRERGYFDGQDFLQICRWKAPRAEHHYSQNLSDDVQAVTTLAFSTADERLKMALFMALHGVNWPMASVMLHFAAKDRYPVLDVRALWSLSIPKVNVYTFGLWWSYTGFCRQLADEVSVDDADVGSSPLAVREGKPTQALEA